MEVPKGYEEAKKRELERRKLAKEKRKQFEKSTEWKVKTYVR